MPSLSNFGVAAAVAAVAFVLVRGMVNMLRQGSSNTSQTLMRWRVGLQFLAIVVIVIVLWARRYWM
jgi:di/tricarboxylate transporter